MKRVQYPQSSEEVQKATKETIKVALQIQRETSAIKQGVWRYNPSELRVLWRNIYDAIDFWTGKTYVGKKKDKNLTNAYNQFFSELLSFLLLCCENENYLPKELSSFARKALYRGRIYRYLGRGEHANNYTPINVNYDGNFVSWTKNPKNHYLELKLYGPITYLTCEIREPYYGIDLAAMEVSRGEEDEVVFPTLREAIIDIQILDDE